MPLLKLVLMILAIICFLMTALGIGWTKGNLLAAGLFFLTFALLIPGAAGS